jgi:hypothetical protein
MAVRYLSRGISEIELLVLSGVGSTLFFGADCFGPEAGVAEDGSDPVAGLSGEVGNRPTAISAVPSRRNAGGCHKRSIAMITTLLH